MLVVLILSLSNIWRTTKIVEVKRDCSFYIYEDNWCCIIPTFAFTCTGKYFEIKLQWFKFVYYASYYLEFMDDD